MRFNQQKDNYVLYFVQLLGCALTPSSRDAGERRSGEERRCTL